MKPKLTKQEREFVAERILELEKVSEKKYISTKGRIDVENAIQHVGTTMQDIDALIELYVDRRNGITTDEMWNYLEGIKCTLQLRYDALWDAHLQREHIDGYGTVEEVMGNHAWYQAQVAKKGKKK
jgi:hypothetical protein